MGSESDTEAPLHKPVNSRQEFLLFLGALIKDYRVTGANWENPTLDRYLDAMRAWNMGGYYRNMGQSVDIEKPTWQMFADILRAARVYE